MSKPILCVDFDGVIHSYTSPWGDEHTIPDPPVPGALEWLWSATEWFNVQIYSSRSSTKEGRMAMMQWLGMWAARELGADHPMCEVPFTFPEKKPGAFLTIDDRALTFKGDWKEFSPASNLLAFKPWNHEQKQKK